MTRTDTYLDAMLRHLGAAYYESLHGRASRSDVARALDTVEEHLSEQSPPSAPARPPKRERRPATATKCGNAGGPGGSAT